MTIGEIYRGIIQVRRNNPAFADKLSAWLEGIINFYGRNILPVTTDIALEWALVSARVGNMGSGNLIAATARRHGLTVVTRNTKHFEVTGVECVNPWLS